MYRSCYTECEPLSETHVTSGHPMGCSRTPLKRASAVIGTGEVGKIPLLQRNRHQEISEAQFLTQELRVISRPCAPRLICRKLKSFNAITAHFPTCAGWFHFHECLNCVCRLTYNIPTEGVSLEHESDHIKLAFTRRKHASRNGSRAAHKANTRKKPHIQPTQTDHGMKTHTREFISDICV